MTTIAGTNHINVSRLLSGILSHFDHVFEQ